MANLMTRTTNSGIELVIDNETGECFAGQNAIARMCEVGSSTIRKFLQGVVGTDKKHVEVLTAGGLQGVTIYNESAMLTCIQKYNPQFLIVFARVGLRVYLHREAGYKVISTATQPTVPHTFAEALRLAADEYEARLIAETKVKELAPKAQFAEDFLETEGLVTVAQLAKDLGIEGFGRNKLYEWLRDHGFLFGSGSNTQPYQIWVNKGYVVMKPTGYYSTGGETMKAFKVYLTPEGVESIVKGLRLDGLL